MIKNIIIREVSAVNEVKCSHVPVSPGRRVTVLINSRGLLNMHVSISRVTTRRTETSKLIE